MDVVEGEDKMSNGRLIAIIRSIMERSVRDKNANDLIQQTFALLLVSKDRISELEQENADLKLRARFKLARKAA